MIRAKYWSPTPLEPSESTGEDFREDGAPASSRRGLIPGARLRQQRGRDGMEARQQSDGLLAREERLTAALLGAGMCAWEWDPVLDRIFASESAVEVFGLFPGQALGSSASRLRLVHPEDVQHQRELFRRPPEHGASWHSEFRITRPRDGRLAWLEERATLQRDAVTGVVRVTGVVWDVTARRLNEAAFRRAHGELEARVAELLRQLARAQEEERRRVSRELHDGLSQELTALVLGLKLLEHELPEGALGRERIREIEMTLGRITREVHDLAVELRPTALDDLGLAPALAAHVDRWSKRTGIVAQFEPVQLEGERLPADIETTVYRVVQEALHNTAKHSAARHVSVIVERRPHELLALIEDDGRGFTVDHAQSAGDRRRLGLIGMRERLGLVGGALYIESEVDRGTTVRGRIPLV